MIYPIADKFKIDTEFGAQAWYGPHEGLDLNGLGGGNTDCGMELRAIYDGEIVHTSESNKDYGNLLVLHIVGPWGERWCRYAHCMEFIKKSGKVKTGDVIAKMGSTGNSTACHLHFDILHTKPAKWRIYTKNLVEYFEDPDAFIKSYKDIMPTPPPTNPYQWLLDFASEKNIKEKDIEGWVRRGIGAIGEAQALREIAEKAEEEHKRVVTANNKAQARIGELTSDLKDEQNKVKLLDLSLIECNKKSDKEVKPKETFWQKMARWFA